MNETNNIESTQPLEEEVLETTAVEEVEQARDVWEMSEEEFFSKGSQEIAEQPTESQSEMAEEKTEVEEVAAPQTEKIKWNGREIELTKSELISFAQQGFNATHKTQELSAYRKKLEKIEDIDDATLDVLARVAKGDKEAFATLMKEHKLDSYELSEIEAKPIERPQAPAIAKEVVEYERIISANEPEVHQKMGVGLQHIPQSVARMFASNPELFKAYYTDVKNGVFDKAMPMVVKKMMSADSVTQHELQTNPNAFLSLYAEVVNTPTEVVVPQVAPKNKVAVQTGNKARGARTEIKDIWDMSEDEFLRQYGKVRLI